MSTIMNVDDLLLRIISNLPVPVAINLQQVLLLAVVVLCAPSVLQWLHSELRGDRAWIRKLPGPKPVLPVIGSGYVLPSDLTDMLTTFEHLAKKFRGFYHLRLWQDCIVVNSPEAAEAVLGSSKHINKGASYNSLLPWLGEGLLTSKGAKWHKRRKMLTPAFHFNILEQFLTVFNEQSDILVQKLRDTNAKRIDLFPFITKATLDVICDAAMGVQIEAQQGNHAEYVNAVHDMGIIVFKRFAKPWLKNDFLFRHSSLYPIQKRSLEVLHSFTKSVIQARKQELAKKAAAGDDDRENGAKKRLAFLDLLLASTIDGQPLSDSDIREEVDTFMFEGHDTTSSGINWTLYNLGRHPDVQVKAYAEVLEAVDHETSGPITKQQLAKMTYLGNVIKESLRLFPSVPIIGRTLASEAMVDGHFIPKSCLVAISMFSIHRDPKHWPDPERFDPDRFSPENSRDRHPFAYVPFSAGPRNCIGQKFALMEERTVIAHILRAFEITAYTPREELKLRADSTLRVEGGLWLSFKPRQH